MSAATLRLMPTGQVVPTPRRIESEPLEIHEARLAAVRKLARRWVMHPAYVLDLRHSNDCETYQAARAPFLADIARRAAADRARNPAFIRAQAVRKALEAA